jgi:hypothetical protein
MSAVEFTSSVLVPPPPVGCVDTRFWNALRAFFSGVAILEIELLSRPVDQDLLGGCRDLGFGSAG